MSGAIEIRPVTYVYGIIAVVLTIVFMSWLGGFTYNTMFMDWSKTPTETQIYMRMLFLLFMPWFITVVVSIIKGGKTNIHELLVIISMVYVTHTFASIWGLFVNITNGGAAVLQTGFHWYFVELLKGAPNYLYYPELTKPELWQSYFYGGPVRWDVWFLPVVFTGLNVLMYYLASLFAVSIFRRQWMEVEDLAFPMATGVVTLMQMGEAQDGRPPILANKYLWAGIIVGALGLAPNWLPFYVPGLAFPSFNYVGWDFTPLALVNWVPLVFAFAPFMIGIAFLAPTTILLSYIICVIIIWWIFAPLTVPLGLWDPMPGGWFGHEVVYNLTGGHQVGPWSRWSMFWGGGWNWFAFGAVFGLLFVPVIINRRETMRTLKAIIGRPDETVEKNEPMPYRIMFLALVLCLLGWWAIIAIGSNGVSISGGRWIFSLIYVGVSILWYTLFPTRMIAEFGQPLLMIHQHAFHCYEQTFCWWPVETSGLFSFLPRQERAWYIRATTFVTHTFQTIADPGITTSEMYKAGALVGVPSRVLFKGILISTPIAIFTALVSFLTFGCMYGFQNLWSHFSIVGWVSFFAPRRGFFALYEKPGYAGYTGPPSPYQWLAFAIGIMISAVLFIVRGFWPWFPIHPVGFPLAWIGNGAQLFIPAIIAYVAKRLMLRIGGLELYTKKGVPFAIGLAVALGIMILITDFTWVYTTLAPK